MTEPVIQKADEAAKAVAAHTTPRMRRMSLLRAYVRGDQYAGRKSWYDKSVPVWEREPCVIWMAPEGVITSNEDFLLGDGRYPTVTSRPEEDDGDEDERLDEESSKLLDRLIRGIEQQADVRAHQRQQYYNAQAVGSCVGVFGARNGKLFADTADAEFCVWTLDANEDVVSLEIRYPYVDIFKDVQGKWTARCRIFRRVIDQQSDITFLPAEGRPDGVEPNQWSEDPAKSVRHGLGFCPVVVHRFRTVSSIVSEPDGHAVHERVLDELDAFNIEASTRHEGAMYSLPQKYEIGVDPGYNPTGEMPAGMLTPASTDGGPIDRLNPTTKHYSNPVAIAVMRGSRKQGPGFVWQYQDPNTKVGQLEVDAGALEALANTMSDLRARICESLAWVPMNPEEVKFAAALSGKALERLLARQMNRVAKDRDGFGHGYLLKSYCMLLRVAQATAGGLKTRGLQKAKSVLDSFATGGWDSPPLSLQWGAWFLPIPEDDQKLVETTKSAYDAKFITRRTAVTKLARTFGIEDINAYLESLEEETEERNEHETKALAAGIARLHSGLGDDDDDPKSNRGGRREDEEQDPGGGGGGAPAPATKASSDRPKRPQGKPG